MNEESSKEIRNLYSFGPFWLDAAERRLTRAGELVPLPRKAFDLLLILVTKPGHLKTREALIEALWPDTIVEEQGLTSKMHALRKALGDEGEAPIYIETVRGIGYRFKAPVGVEKLAVGPPASPPEERSPSGPQRPKRNAPLGYGMAVAVLILVIAGLLTWHFLPSGEARPATARSIAVLPFENLSADKRNAYFAAGIRDTILTRLAELNAFRVVSRSSSDAYSSHPADLKKIGRELDVNMILEGSVQKAGDRVLINVQLIDVSTDAHIWAATYTRTLEDIFAVEGDVASKVATELASELRPAQLARLKQAPTEDSQAYLLYLKANHNARRAFDFANTADPQATVAEATSFYREALTRDPGFALAWARLSLLDSKAYWFEIGHDAHRKAAARQAAERALALAPDLAQAHVALGYAYYYGDRNYAAALKQFRLARESLPRNAGIIGAMAYIHRRQGEWARALNELRRAARLDLRNPHWRNEIGTTLMTLRRYTEAEQEFNEALAIAPESYDAKMLKIGLLLLTGDLEQAHRELAAIPVGKNPQGFISSLRFDAAWLAHKPDAALATFEHWAPYQPLRADVWALKGDPTRARHYYEESRRNIREALLRQPDNPNLWSALGLAEAGLGNKMAALKAGKRATELRPLSKDHVAAPIYLNWLAQIHARLHEPAAAVKLLEKLLSIPSGSVISVPFLRLDPVWDPLRDDPAFQALLQKYSNPALAATQ